MTHPAVCPAAPATFDLKQARVTTGFKVPWPCDDQGLCQAFIAHEKPRMVSFTDLALVAQL